MKKNAPRGLGPCLAAPQQMLSAGLTEDAQGLEFRDSGFGVLLRGFWLSGFGFRAQGFGFSLSACGLEAGEGGSWRFRELSTSR